MITIVESTDLMNMKIIAGEVDVQAAGLSESFSNYPLFAQYADEMNYRLTTVEHNEPGALNFHFNITSVDPVKAPYLSNVEFRRALSLGMDRPTIISTFYAIGPFVSEIAQSSFLENSPYYDEEWTKQYTQFDPETANKMLDEMGMTQYDENGWRMTADGKAFDLVILVPNYDVQWGEVAEMVASEWRENLKLNINASIVEPSLWGERTEGNEFDITALTGSGDNGFLAVTTGSVDTWTRASYNWGNHHARHLHQIRRPRLRAHPRNGPPEGTGRADRGGNRRRGPRRGDQGSHPDLERRPVRHRHRPPAAWHCGDQKLRAQRGHIRRRLGLWRQRLQPRRRIRFDADAQ